MKTGANGSAAGAVVTVEGSGLRPGSVVTIEFDGTSLGAVNVKVAPNGTYRAIVELPSGIAPGAHRLVVTGRAWDDSRVAVSKGLVSAGATALTVNLTVTEPSSPGYITVYPCGAPRPSASATNYTTDETRANVVDVPFESGAAIWRLVDTDAIIDVQGFHGPSNENRIVPRTATRLVDTHPGDELAAGETRVVQVVGTGMASTSASVVALNIATTETEGPGFITVFRAATTARSIPDSTSWAATMVSGTFVVASTVVASTRVSAAIGCSPPS